MKDEDRIFHIVEDVWTSFVGIKLERRSEQELSGVKGYFLVASIEIEGAWKGEVALFCSESLAHRVAAHLFEMDPAEVTDEEVRETLGEINNIISGNLKRLLPEPCHLSAPVVGYEKNAKGNAKTIVDSKAIKVLAVCERQFIVVMLADRRQQEKLAIEMLGYSA